MNYQTVMLQLPLVRDVSTSRITTPGEVQKCCSDIAQLAQETFMVVSLDARNNVINKTLCTLGIADAALIHPREAFRQAIQDNASAIVLVHNHPSGDPRPSLEDIKITKALIAAGEIIGIQVQDHVILCQNGKRSSIRKEGICKF
jgi:DNA repair protein RadC